ncbi:hypothetical protein EVU96_06340 [Bacillus infantis]|uniref:hypothetical protein n=1 Tax=Bacillus infantis TaxID=324767 RepID=UPI00101C5986|nr:hypothetical protein [Bacillus infantis]RYI31622.1 hypothetical protein EVU96_06340 [Bacillus infantis]
MESFVFALASLLLLVPIFYFLPLGISGKGKILLIAASFLLSMLAIMASVQFHVWQSLLLVCLMALVTAYLLEKKLATFFKLGHESSGDELEREQQGYQPENNEHYIELGNSPEESAGSAIEESLNSEAEEYESFQASADAGTEEKTDILDSWELEDSHELKLEGSESGAEHPGEGEAPQLLIDDVEFLEKKIDGMAEEKEEREGFEKDEEDSFSYLSEIEELIEGEDGPSAETGSESNDSEVLDEPSEQADILSGSHLSEIEELMEYEGEGEPSAETGSESNSAEEVYQTSEQADVLSDSYLTETEELRVPEDVETEVEAAGVSAQGHKDISDPAAALDDEETENEQIEELIGEIIQAETSGHSGVMQDQEEWEELEIIEAPFEQDESGKEELPGQPAEEHSHAPIESDAEAGGPAGADSGSEMAAEDLQRSKKGNIELQQQMILSVVSQLRLSRHSIGQYEYESILKDQLKPNLDFKHYYSFASLLIEHYMQTKELDKLQELLHDLSSRTGGNPVIEQEINFLVQKYSNQ